MNCWWWPIYFLFGIIVAVIVLATGSTFGQRCERLGFARNSYEWQECVQRLDGYKLAK